MISKHQLHISLWKILILIHIFAKHLSRYSNYTPLRFLFFGNSSLLTRCGFVISSRWTGSSVLNRERTWKGSTARRLMVGYLDAGSKLYEEWSVTEPIINYNMFCCLLFVLPCITISQFHWGSQNMISKSENKILCKSFSLNT